MQCPYCNHDDSKVIDSRTSDNGVRRRRECIRCGLRFTTYENVHRPALLVVKNDLRREEFSRDKLRDGIARACAKRPISYDKIEEMAADIETDLHDTGNVEIHSNVIGRMVMERLRGLDRVAYVRFASVYRDFQDIESFEEVVRDLREEAGQRSKKDEASTPSKSGRRQQQRLL